MITSYLPAPGDLVDPAELHIEKARELAQILLARRLAFVELVECRREKTPVDTEVIVVDIKVERGQYLVHEINRVERIAVRFFGDDRWMPETLALRVDFPIVPHLNLRTEELPRSLCLFDEPYDEIKLRWTAASFIERIRTWLAQTARGELHAPDQPLELLLLGAAAPLILPTGLFDSSQLSQPARLMVYPLKDGTGNTTYIASLEERIDLKGVELPCVATVLCGEPQIHGVIHRLPRNIKNLHDFLESADLDLLGELRERLRQWQREANVAEILNCRLVVIIFLPKTRTVGGAVEATDIYAFVSTAPLHMIGEQMGVWQLYDGKPGAVLVPDPTKQGEGVELVQLNPMAAFSRDRAALLSGRPDPGPKPIAVVGLGALGSQVFTNLLRLGYAPWTLIDKDILLPHNLARNALDGWAVGYAKVEALAATACHMLNDPKAAMPLVVDVLHPGKRAADLTQALAGAATILDMAASVSVARALACDYAVSARRISLFLNPAGTDLVLLAQDADRAVPLDLLEMQYYRLLVQEETLHQHLQVKSQRQRYARSCRDVSMTIPQDLMALHAGIGSRAVGMALASPCAQVVIWQAHTDEMTVTCVRGSPAALYTQEVNGWTIITDACLLEQLHRQRQSKLPNETGGVLIGAYDQQRRRIYVMLSLPSPPDSVEWPTLYIRGCQGLEQRVEEIGAITGGQLGYVGEWHSHPQGHNCTPSADDQHALRWLANERAVDGLPGLMVIVGEDACGWYLEDSFPDTT